uniref:Uncharacterized protein n=1 Tax=Anguilla anguilla TaxID=7936 RepID=A0A0E9RHU7_ANGAN
MVGIQYAKKVRADSEFTSLIAILSNSNPGGPQYLMVSGVFLPLHASL